MSTPREFERDGYTVVEHVITDQQCADLSSALPNIEGSGTRVLLTFTPFQTLASELRTHPELSPYVGDLVAIQCILFRKSSDHNWSVSLHRDMVLPIQGTGPWKSAGVKEGLDCVMPSRAFLDRCLVIRLHLDGAPVEDVSVVPGSHANDLEHARTDATAIPVAKGGALVMRPTLLHASSKLPYQGHRRVLHYVFAPRNLPVGYTWHQVV